MPANDIVGLDIGQAKSGVARASNVAKLAEPLYSVPTSELLNKLKTLIKEQGIEEFVVGLPRNLNGEDTAQTQLVRDWVISTKEQIPEAVFYFQDEALTSKLAEAHNLKLKKKVDDDALAAAIILQDFIDTPATERLIC